MKTVIPLHYELNFEPNLKTFTFNGTETIYVQCSKPTKTIILDAAELKITECYVTSKNNHFKTKTKLDEKKEKLQINLPDRIKGKAKIQITFSGILNDKLLGFYRSQYKYKGKTKYLATTQFEAADARRAFPCWDEPEAKATFSISILADKNFLAISNMPVTSKKKFGTKTLFKFAKTPVMSTYLIYLGVGEFEFLKSKIGKIHVSVVTTKGNKSKGKYALQLGKKLLRAYENYFGIKYPLPKLDLIAVPDFAAGAMENWGAITFRETILLYDPNTSSTRTKQYIAEVISHEIAHMWFGNLTTMKWWNDLWLNESFATFMATKFVDKFYPDWDMWDQFIEDSMNVAMALDSLKSSHPIDVKVKSPSEIREIFDAISYDKGGCVLRMLENYVSEKNFRNGLKQYLTKHKYKNATGQDLWNSIGRVSKLPVNAMVNTWLKQVGFPIVQVEKQNSKLFLKQKRYLLAPTKSTQKGLWHIPLSIESKNQSVKKLMKTKTDKIMLKKNDQSFVVNSNRNGFYRVKYDQSTLLDLRRLIDEKLISHLDRWAIQNDLYSFCISGDESIQNYLDFSDAYLDEDNYLVSLNVASNLYSLFLRTFDEEFSEEIADYAKNFFEHILHRLGWDAKKDEKPTDALLRAFAISALGKLDSEEITEEAERRFKKFLKKPDSLNPDLQDPVFSIIAWNGDSKTHKKLTSLFKVAKTQEEKLRFLGALSSFQDESLLLKSLNFSLTPFIRSQNMQLPIMKVASNPYGKRILWPWLKKHWKTLNNKVGYGNPLFNRIVASIAQVADITMEKEIRQFFKKNPTPGTKRTQEQTLERIKINSKFLKILRQEFKN